MNRDRMSARVSEKKKATITSDEIARLLEQTGFVFEMLTNLDFEKLMRDASSAVEMLRGLSVPKLPPPMVGILGGGTA
jgi:hypothetical protein